MGVVQFAEALGQVQVPAFGLLLRMLTMKATGMIVMVLATIGMMMMMLMMMLVVLTTMVGM